MKYNTVEALTLPSYGLALGQCGCFPPTDIPSSIPHVADERVWDKGWNGGCLNNYNLFHLSNPLGFVHWVCEWRLWEKTDAVQSKAKIRDILLKQLADQTQFFSYYHIYGSDVLDTISGLWCLGDVMFCWCFVNVMTSETMFTLSWLNLKVASSLCFDLPSTLWASISHT